MVDYLYLHILAENLLPAGVENLLPLVVDNLFLFVVENRLA